jgi:signal transduction histidine kinase
MSSLRSNAALRPLYGCTALLILVLLATNAAILLKLRESEMLDQEQQLRNLSLTLAEQADRSFQSVDLVIESVAERIAAEGVTGGGSFTQKLAGRDMHRLLREKISGLPQLDAVTLINRDGKLINFSRSWPVPEVDVSDRDYFQALKDDPTRASYVSAPVRNRGTGTWTIFVARRVSGADGEFLGLILGAIEMRYFEDFYQAIVGEGGSIVILRLDGVMIARFPRTEAIGKILNSSDRLLPDGISGSVREPSPIDGQMRLKAARILAHYPLFMLTTKTEEAALRDWWEIARLTSLGALVCAVSIGIAGFAVGRQWKQQVMLAEAKAEIQRQNELSAAFEAMRKAKEAAEAADRAKSEFLANMSHELRTPLNAILGFSDLMINEVSGPLGNDRYRTYAADIHASGSRLLSIINNVLDLSKSAAGKLELVADWIDVREIVNSTSRLIRPLADKAKLSLTVDMLPGDLVVYADERLLRQILLNLLSNACKFTPSGGRVDCAVSANDAGISFTVTDTGIGIPAEHLDRISKPFVQVDSSLNRRHEGTGLGLALVKAMAELHGGCLRLASEEGRGTVAAVVLPRSRLPVENGAGVAENAAPARAVEPAACTAHALEPALAT